MAIEIPKQSIHFAALAVPFFFMTDTGLLPNGAAALYLAGIAFLIPRLAAPLLLILISVEDSPGLSHYWWYGGFGILGMMIVLQPLYARMPSAERLLTSPANRHALFFALGTLCLLAYGFGISVLFDYTGIKPQSELRNPVLTGVLRLIVLAVALRTVSILIRPSQFPAVMTAVVLIMIHTVFVIVVQIAFGPETFASSGAVDRFFIDEAEQVLEANALGIPRLTGVFVGPNTFALTVNMLALVPAMIRPAIISNKLYMLSFVSFALLVSLVTFSKSNFLFAGFVGMLFIARNISLRFAVICVVAMLGLLMMRVTMTNGLDTFFEAMRVPTSFDDIGYRGIMWAEAIDNLEIKDWFMGTGFSYWIHFYEQHVEFTARDPHNWILSITGSYGVAGLLMYVWLFVLLVKALLRLPINGKIVAAMLLFFVYFKELVTPPTAFNYSPVTYLLYLGIFCVLTYAQTRPQAQEKKPKQRRRIRFSRTVTE